MKIGYHLVCDFSIKYNFKSYMEEGVSDANISYKSERTNFKLNLKKENNYE